MGFPLSIALSSYFATCNKSWKLALYLVLARVLSLFIFLLYFNSRAPTQPSSGKYSSRSAEEVQEILDDISYNSNKDKQSGKSRSKKIQSSDTVYRQSTEKESVDDAWSPTSYAAFKLLVSSRFAAALWTTISDCDETYNYWEPVMKLTGISYTHIYVCQAGHSWTRVHNQSQYENCIFRLTTCCTVKGFKLGNILRSTLFARTRIYWFMQFLPKYMTISLVPIRS